MYIHMHICVIDDEYNSHPTLPHTSPHHTSSGSVPSRSPLALFFFARFVTILSDFCSYASLYHQKQMLTDHRRMQAYYSGEIIGIIITRAGFTAHEATTCSLLCFFFFFCDCV